MTIAKDPGGEHALEHLLDDVQPRLRSILASFRIPYADAEDLLQQTILTFLVKRDGIREPSAWLTATLRNRCLMYWRSYRRKLYESVDVAILETLGEPERPDQERVELTSDLNTVIRRLTPKCRNVLRLRYGLDCDPAETAERLGYRSSGIYKILERCLAGLTRKLVAAGMIESP